MLFNEVVPRMKNFFENHFIVINNDESSEDQTEDVLLPFLGNKNPNSELEQVEEVSIPPADVKIYDRCLNHPILIAKTILESHKRTAASSNLKQIGYQHIYRHKMIDTDGTSNSSISSILTSSSLDDFFSEDSNEPDVKKRKLNGLKTCQQKIYMDCQNLLLPHDDNYTLLSHTMTKLEILILCPSNSINICRSVASHLGFIVVEDMFRKIDLNSKKGDLIIRTRNKCAKLYSLFQNYVSRCMMLGCSNISLTCDHAIFQNMNSDIKCMFFNEEDMITDVVLRPHLNMTVKVVNNTFSEYVSAITEVMDHTMEYKTSLPAVYCMSDIDGKKKYYKCKFPAVGIIPLYILKFFVKKKMAEELVVKSFFFN